MMEDHYKSVNHHNNNNTTALTKARSVPTATEFTSTAVAATLEMTAKMETIETIAVAQTAGQTIPEMTIVTTTTALGKETIIMTEAVTTMTTAVSQINVETPTTSVTVTSIPTESELASTTGKIMTTAMKDAVVLKKTAVTTARTIGKTASPTTKITTVPGVAKTIEEATIAAEIGVVTSVTATTNVAATMTTVATTATTTALTNFGQYISSNLYPRTENIHSRIRTQLEMNSSSFNLLEENNHNPPLFTEHMHSDNFDILRDQHRNSRNVNNLQRRLINDNSSHASFDYMFLNRRNIRSRRHSSRIGGVGSISNNNNRNCNTTISIPTSVEKILEANEQSCKNEHDVNCPICFDNIQNVAYCFKCLQKFCLLCISKWTELRRICPLCNQYLRSIIYNVKSKNSYLVREEYGLVRRPEYYNNRNNNNNNNDSDDDTTQSDEDDMYFIQDFIRRRYMSSRRSSDAFFQRTTPSQRRQNISRRPLLSSDTSGVLFRQRRDIHSTINTNSDISMQSTYRLFNTSQSESLSQERPPIMPREAAVAIIQRKDICSILWDLASQGIQMIVNFIHRIICYFGFTVSD